MTTIEHRQLCGFCGKVIGRRFEEKENWEGKKIIPVLGICQSCQEKKGNNGNLKFVQNYLGRKV